MVSKRKRQLAQKAKWEFDISSRHKTTEIEILQARNLKSEDHSRAESIVGHIYKDEFELYETLNWNFNGSKSIIIWKGHDTKKTHYGTAYVIE